MFRAEVDNHLTKTMGPRSLQIAILLCALTIGYPLGAQTNSQSREVDPQGVAAEKLLDDAMNNRRPDQFTRAGAYDAQLLIDACWNTNRERFQLRDAQKLEKAYENIATCMEETIGRRMPSILRLDRGLSEEKIKAIFDELRTPFQVLYFFMMNRNSSCVPQCSAGNEVLYLLPYTRYLEDVIREMEYTRATYNLAPMSVPKK